MLGGVGATAPLCPSWNERIFHSVNGPKPQAPKGDRRSTRVGATYRGVRIQATGGQTRFSTDQIKRAVKAAFEKNADALAGRT